MIYGNGTDYLPQSLIICLTACHSGERHVACLDKGGGEIEYRHDGGIMVIVT